MKETATLLRLGVAALGLSLMAHVPPDCRGQDPSASLFGAVFSDHAVLQRDRPLPVWGTAQPSDTITVVIGNSKVQTVANHRGDWSATLAGMSAGGPFTLTGRSSSGLLQEVRDVVIGDVFLCSGQSNMEWPVSLTLNAGAETRAAADSQIRLMNVGRAASTAPLQDFSEPVEWQVASPETVGDWSAVCYYFARELRHRVQIPIGLISSSWGGSAIRAWVGAEALLEIGGYEDALSVLRLFAEDERAAQRLFGDMWETWWHTANQGVPDADPWQPDEGKGWPLAPPDLGDWKDWGQSDLQNHLGMVWHRGIVALTPEQANHSVTLELGGIDEVDQTWINGHVVGHTFGWGTERSYHVPPDLLRPGENVIVVNVLNTWGAGGMTGDPAILTLAGDTVRVGAWKYRMVPTSLGHPPRAPWESIAGVAGLHNAMIAPLRNYAIRAAAWYQGESDTGGGTREYLRLLNALKSQWRGLFGEELPVLVVQLPNFGERSAFPTESGWAEVREAQRLATVGDPNAGLAVTIDIGDEYDLHPRNKQEVGRRLAQAARHTIYGEAISPSGPAPLSATHTEGSVVVTFTDVEGSLIALGGVSPVGFELCGREPSSCRYADADLTGNDVVLKVQQGETPTRVRYCWADNPICTLYDPSGLPAGPFELAISE